ncbi:MAG TPA: sigma 54-interacting transcriptional regulator, partial [Burkholderiaceae bacterium]|nr:sigma 54-interacting transcriptional regulator [Burkholderiaceae bacterium]
VAPGAYTGADRRGRDGKFRLADGGTLFLDEIGDMPLALQSKLLRVLEERAFEPVGSNQVVDTDVRVIAATSRDLNELVQRGDFRADLYYRLNVLPIRLPPLRERIEDLVPLCEHLLELIAVEHDIAPRELDAPVLQALAGLPWHGNVRELRNLLEQVSLFSDDIRVTLATFEKVMPGLSMSAAPPADGARGAAAARRPGAVAAPPAGPPTDDAAGTTPAPAAAGDDPGLDLPARIARLEVQAIRAALAACGGNRVQAARRLGIARATLYQKLSDYPELSDFRTERSSNGD